jgi:hypothetical protein
LDEELAAFRVQHRAGYEVAADQEGDRVRDVLGAPDLAARQAGQDPADDLHGGGVQVRPYSCPLGTGPLDPVGAAPLTRKRPLRQPSDSN